MHAYIDCAACAVTAVESETINDRSDTEPGEISWL